MHNFLSIKEIWQINENQLGILWSDGNEQALDVHKLRSFCPCAKCVDEISGKRLEQKIPDNCKPIEISSVGRYALGITFSDGHNTGIYSFEYLKKNSELLSA